MIRVRLTPSWFEEWYHSHKKHSNISEVIRNLAWDGHHYPDNVEKLLDKTVNIDGEIDPSKLTEFEYHYLYDKFKDLEYFFYKLDKIHYVGDFADTKKKIITLENFSPYIKRDSPTSINDEGVNEAE